ncbi:MAG: hypothetical protein HQ513_09090 [Rhodospirillales bacterium]|nr:hypothetical protein [Rhodospirillales bacterium]
MSDKTPPEVPQEKKPKRKRKRKRKRNFTGVLIPFLSAVLIMGVAAAGLFVISSPETGKNGDEKPPTLMQRAEQLKAEQKKIAEQMEKTATERTFHCNLLYRYYKGSEPKLPLAELVGLSRYSSEEKITSRCAEFFPAVKLMGGWPTSETAQDNFIVCAGFQVVVPRVNNLTITPIRIDLARGKVSYSVPGKWVLKEEIKKKYARRLSRLAPLVLQVDSRCILVGLPRTKKAGQILGIIRRVE